MNFKNNSICKLFSIEFPLIQAGMVWVSGGKLAAACSNAGILGIIGAGSMTLDLLQHHILKAQSLTTCPFGVNIPLLYSGAQEQIDLSYRLGVRIFFTSAGNPKKWTPMLKEKGCTVVHVISNPEMARKCQEVGVDAVVAEGFEAGGHNGREELTTLVLVPQVVRAVTLPVIAAGGIIDARSMAAAMCLGAQGVQMGTRFVATEESSAHPNFKKMIIESRFDSTKLMMKNLVPVRLMKNQFYQQVSTLEERCASAEELQQLLGKGRAKKGMLEGDLVEGELEIGQGCSLVKDIPTVNKLIFQMQREFSEVLKEFTSSKS